MGKRAVHVIVAFFVLSGLLLFFALDAAQASSDKSNKPQFLTGVGTEIKALPYIISSPGFYYITQDLSCVAESKGITIEADNVTLDLMGFSLIGPGGTETKAFAYGIYMNERFNIEIQNGTVVNFQSSGIVGLNTDAAGYRIINVRAINNLGTGIAVHGKGNLVKNCTAVGNGGRGIEVGQGATIDGCTCSKNYIDGIFAYAGSTVIGNTCRDNGHEISPDDPMNPETCGIRIAGEGATVTGNTCSGNYIGIGADKGSTITGNTCGNNVGSYGIYVMSGSTVIGNTCSGNTGTGIYLIGNSLVDQNTAYDNETNMENYFPCTFGTNHAPPPSP